MPILGSLSGMFSKLTTMLSSNDAYSSLSDEPTLPPWNGEPTILDVLAVKNILANLRPHSLPTELIDIIIDHAEYWPHTTSFPHPSCRAHQDANILVTRCLPLGYPDTSVPITYPLTPQDYAPGPGAQNFFPAREFMKENYETTTTKVLGKWMESSMPDTKLEHPCRKIVFNIRSHDQGWGGRHDQKGTYEGSFTWFDIGLQRLVGLDINKIPKSVLEAKPRRAEEEEDSGDYSSEDERTTQEERYLMHHNRGATNGELEGWGGLRFDIEEIEPRLKSQAEVQAERGQRVEGWRQGAVNHPYLPHEKTLQKNRTATGSFSDHEIVLSWTDDADAGSDEAEEMEKELGRGKEIMNGELVRGLRVGDVVAVWARSRFPGWMNVVDTVEIKVYWAV